MRKQLIVFLSYPRLPLLLVMVAMILSLPSLWSGFQFDDFMQRHILLKTPLINKYFGKPLSMFAFVDGNPERTRRLMDIGIMPWWSLDNVRLTFWRPITEWTHRLDYSLWSDNTVLMHMHSLVWFAGVVFVVALIYRKFMNNARVAGLAALLYTIDDAHAMPASWLANRNALVGAFFGLLTLLFHDRWRRSGDKTAAAIAPLCLMLALLSNEGAIAIFAYLLGYAMFLDRKRPGIRTLSLVSYVAVIIGWKLGYSFKGYGVWGAGAYIDPLYEPLLFLKAVCLRAPILFLGQWFLPPSDLFLIYPPSMLLMVWMGALFFLIGLSLFFMPLLRGNPVACFWYSGMLLSLVPCCTIFPADRLLLFVGVGAMGLLAQFFHRLWTEDNMLSLSVIWRFLARPLFYVFIFLHLIVAPLLLPGRILAFTALGNLMKTCIEKAPLDNNATDRTVILVNPPNFFFASTMPFIRAINGQSIPARIRSLGPNMGMVPVPISIKRTNQYTLVVEPHGGFPLIMMRDENHPFAVGDIITLSDMSVEIKALTERGWPQAVAYRFTMPLEASSLVWLKFQNNSYVPFTLPKVGESMVLHQ